MKNNFYTAREAQERLGMDKNSFYYLVRKGTFKSVTLPGRKHSVYPKSEIDKFSAAIKTVMEQYDRETSTFQKATPDDMQEEFAMDVSLYGRNTAPVNIRLAKLERNPESDYVLKNENEIVGHISFTPIEPETLEDFLKGEVDTIEADKLLPFTTGKPLDVLFVVMSVKPGFPPDVSKHYGQRLISGAVHIARELGERGIEIRNIYATSRTGTGIRICRKLGMKEEPVPNERGRYRFTLNVLESDSLLVREYKQGLAEYIRKARLNADSSDRELDRDKVEQSRTGVNSGRQRKGTLQAKP